MRRFPRLLIDAIALLSMLAGAVLAVFPALIVLIVTLFYDSAGGVLILLGSLISVLPHPASPAHGTAAGAAGLPMFQELDTGTSGLLIRSLLGTMACAIALGLLIAFRGRDRRSALAALVCCLLAAAICGREVAMVLTPAALALLVRLLPQQRPA